MKKSSIQRAVAADRSAVHSLGPELIIAPLAAIGSVVVVVVVD